MNLKNKIALITGGSTGIGKAIAKAFLDKGAKVIIFGLNRPDYKCEFHKVDVRKEEEIKSALSKIKEIDVLVNNAGIFVGGNIEKVKTEDVDKIFDVNFNGVFWCSKYAIPKMNKGGGIINISSIRGLRPRVGGGLYAATKAAIISLTKTLAFELADKDIRVSCIAPGVIRTPIWGEGEEAERDIKMATSEYPFKRAGKPEEIAHAAVFLAENEFVTGIVLPVDGGATI